MTEREIYPGLQLGALLVIRTEQGQRLSSRSSRQRVRLACRCGREVLPPKWYLLAKIKLGGILRCMRCGCPGKSAVSTRRSLKRAAKAAPKKYWPLAPPLVATPARKKQDWTKEELEALDVYAPVLNLHELTRRLPGRSLEAVRFKRFTVPALREEKLTKKAWCLQTGYSGHQWDQARKGMQEFWGVNHPEHGVTEEQGQQLAEWLRLQSNPRWSLRYAACVKCGRADLIGNGRHWGRGLCRRDFATEYSRLWRSRAAAKLSDQKGKIQ